MPRIYKVLMWLPAVLIPLGMWWAIKIPAQENPSAGLAELALAIMATLMALAWEKAGPFAKSAWIATVFVFALVGYRAIINNEQAAAKQQNKILEEEYKSFQDIPDRKHKHFQQAMNQERNDFDKMLSEIAMSRTRSPRAYLP